MRSQPARGCCLQCMPAQGQSENPHGRRRLDRTGDRHSGDRPGYPQVGAGLNKPPGSVHKLGLCSDPRADLADATARCHRARVPADRPGVVVPVASRNVPAPPKAALRARHQRVEEPGAGPHWDPHSRSSPGSCSGRGRQRPPRSYRHRHGCRWMVRRESAADSTRRTSHGAPDTAESIWPLRWAIRSMPLPPGR